MTTLADKKPNEIKKYAYNEAPFLDEQGITISTIVSVTADAGLTVDSNALSSDSKKITVTLSGGTAGVVYKVAAKFTTSDGQTLEDDIFIPVTAVKG